MKEHIVNFDNKMENPHFEGVFDITPQELQKVIADVKNWWMYGSLMNISANWDMLPGAELVVLDTLS